MVLVPNFTSRVYFCSPKTYQQENQCPCAIYIYGNVYRKTQKAPSVRAQRTHYLCSRPETYEEKRKLRRTHVYLGNANGLNFGRIFEKTNRVAYTGGGAIFDGTVGIPTS